MPTSPTWEETTPTNSTTSPTSEAPSWGDTTPETEPAITLSPYEKARLQGVGPSIAATTGPAHPEEILPLYESMLEPAVRIPRIKAQSALGKIVAAPINVAAGLAEGAISPVGALSLGMGGPVVKGLFAGLAAKEAGRALGEASVTKDPGTATEGLLSAGLAPLIALHGSLPMAKPPENVIPTREIGTEKGKVESAGQTEDVTTLRNKLESSGYIVSEVGGFKGLSTKKLQDRAVRSGDWQSGIIPDSELPPQILKTLNDYRAAWEQFKKEPPEEAPPSAVSGEAKPSEALVSKATEGAAATAPLPQATTEGNVTPTVTQAAETGAEAPVGPGAKTVGEPEYPAISQLTDQLKAAAPEGQPASIPALEQVAEKWAEGKSLAERGIGKMLAIGQGLKHAARGLRDITDAERRVSTLDADLQLSMGRSRDAGKAIERQQPNKTVRDAVALWIDTPGTELEKAQTLSEALAQLPKGTRPSIRRAIEMAAKLPPEARQFAESIRQYYGIRENDAVAHEIFEHGLDDYFTHIWGPDAAKWPEELKGAISNGRISSYFQFARQRKLGMFLDGILKGKTPVLDPAKVVPYYNYALDRAIASREFVKDLSDLTASDGRPAVAPTGIGDRVGQGETPDALIIRPRAVGEKVKDYRQVDHPALRKWKWIGTDTDGKPVMQLSDLVVHPEFYERVARMMDRGRLSAGPIASGILRAGSEVKAFKLGLISAFHQVHVGSHALWHWTNPFNVSNKAWIDKASGDINWDHPFVREAIEQGHLKLAPDPAELKLFSEGILSHGLVHKIPIIGTWSKAYSEWFFTRYIPKLKLATYENALDRNMKWYEGKASPEQIAARAGDAVNNAYGELNRWFLGKNGRQPGIQRLLQGIFLAPDFGEARLRFAGKAATKFGGEERLALATMFMTMYTGARVANFLSHGDPEMDPKRAFMVKVGDHWWTMRSVLGDLVHAYSDFSGFLRNRLSPLYGQAMLGLITGRDERGLKQDKFKLLMEQPAKALIPIQFGALNRDDQKLWESFVTSMGLTAIRDAPEQEIHTLVNRWKQESGNPKLVAQVERAQQETLAPSDYNNLRHYLQWESYDDALKELGKLRAQGKTTDQILQALSPRKPFTGSGRYEDAFIRTLNPDQRYLYERAQDNQLKNYQKLLGLLQAERQPIERPK